MTEKLTFDAQQALGLLRLVVFEKGKDFLYANPDWTHRDLVDNTTKCVNFHGDEPGCIVGHVLSRLGLTAEQAKVLGISGGASAYDSCTALNQDDGFGWEFTDNAVILLTEAQSHQDSRSPWGEALAKAEAEYRALMAEK